MANFAGIYFNEIPMPDFVKVLHIEHSILPPISQNLLTVGGKAGAYDFGNNIGTREISIDIAIVLDEENTLPQKLEELSAWLLYDEPKELILGDNPNRYYLAKFTGDSNIKESFLVGEGTLTFLCTEPYIYGLEREILIPTDYAGEELEIVNTGNAETFPRMRFEITRDVTNFSIVSGDEFIDFGSPYTVDTTEDDVVDAGGYVLRDLLVSTNGWTQAPSVTGGTVTGTFEVYNGNCFRQAGLDYGTGSSWHGASMVKQFSQPVQDFEANLFFMINTHAVAGYIGTITLKTDLAMRSGASTRYPVKKTGKKNEVYKVLSKASNGWYRLENGLYCSNSSAYSTFTPENVGANKLGKILFTILDENGSPMVLAHMQDATANYRSLQSEVKVVKGASSYTIVRKNIPSQWHHCYGKYVIKRRKNVWEVSLYIWVGNRWSRHYYVKWTDSKKTYMNKASKIQLATLAFSNYPAVYMEIRDVVVKTLDNVIENNKIPLILRAGDVLEIDNETGAILKNDRPFYEYLNPSSTFIKLQKGVNGLVISPADAFTNGSISYTERTL
jgi:predicted phage tail component-like protein